MADKTRVPLAQAVCKACGRSLPLSSFWKDSNRASGHFPTCRECVNTHKRAIYATRPERKRQANRDYNASHRDKIREYGARWHQENRERRNTEMAAHRRAPENVERYRAYQRSWSADNPDKAKAKERKYRESHPHVTRQANAKRKARLRGATIEKVNYESILQRDGWVCHICGGAITTKAELNFDHLIPLARGGRHSAENLSPSHALCNGRKGTKIVSSVSPPKLIQVTEVP